MKVNIVCSWWKLCCLDNMKIVLNVSILLEFEKDRISRGKVSQLIDTHGNSVKQNTETNQENYAYHFLFFHAKVHTQACLVNVASNESHHFIV